MLSLMSWSKPVWPVAAVATIPSLFVDTAPSTRVLARTVSWGLIALFLVLWVVSIRYARRESEREAYRRVFADAGLDEYSLTKLATYNSERSRGIPHTEQYAADMARLQKRFDAASRQWARQRGMIIVGESFDTTRAHR